MPSHQKSLFALGVAFATYGLTVLSPEGNGFIAVFVAAIVLGVRRPDLRLHFERRADEIVEIVKLGIFLVFGSLLTLQRAHTRGLAGARVRRRRVPARAPGGGVASPCSAPAPTAPRACSWAGSAPRASPR